MDFAYDVRTEALRTELLDFMDTHVYAAEPEFADVGADGRPRVGFARPTVLADLSTEARRRGLWNLFLPDADDGAGLSLLEYTPLAEVSGRSPLVAPEAMNCAAPDTGNME